jgi:hypothetical protein
VIELTDKKIVVQKGDEKWEIARTAETKVDGDPQVGGKVTVEYRMVAASIEVKAAKATEQDAAKDAPKAKAVDAPKAD